MLVVGGVLLFVFGNMCVSSCRCCVLVSDVHPVANLSTVFCVVCSVLKAVRLFYSCDAGVE